MNREEAAVIVCRNDDDDEKKPKRKYDMIVFGGSGFIGRMVVAEMYRFSRTYNFTWAVAGRDANKLREALDDAWKRHVQTNGTALSDAGNTTITTPCRSCNVDIVRCDASDANTVAEMVRTARLVINCVGPYCVYGETVVEHCVSNGTHYVDVTAESLFTDHMAYAYDGRARASGTVVVNALGLESVPSDMGVEFLYKHFKGQLQHVDAYMKIHDIDGRHVVLKRGGALMNHGTWESVLLHLAERKRRRRYRDLLDESMPGMSECRPKPNVTRRLHRRRIYTTNEITGAGTREWCFTFPEPDQAIVARSIHHARTVDGLPYDFCVRNYMIIGGLALSVLALFAYVLLTAVTTFNAVRNLYARHPRVFSLGMASKTGPDERSMNDLRMSLTLIGCGTATAAGGGDGAAAAATRETVAKVVAANPGYGFTSKTVILGAITILKDSEHIPKGGVLTPAAAFRHTQFVDRLIEHGVATFQIESDMIVDDGKRADVSAV